MSKRILAMRLGELEGNGFIARAERRRGYIRWQLTSKGADVLPVLLTLIHFGSKWRVPEASPGGPILPRGEAVEIFLHRKGVAATTRRPT